MYEKQVTYVRWNDIMSKSFPITKGVKQGAVRSPRIYPVYIDELFDILRKK